MEIFLGDGLRNFSESWKLRIRAPFRAGLRKSAVWGPYQALLRMELQERDGPLPKKQQSGIIELATIVATEHVDDEDRPGLRESDDDQVGASEPSEGVDLQPKLPLITLALSSMIAAGIQFGWALQLSLLTPYIQVSLMKVYGFSVASM